LALVWIFLFALANLFDFSGYSDMAIGLGKMFGQFKEIFWTIHISQKAQLNLAAMGIFVRPVFVEIMYTSRSVAITETSV